MFLRERNVISERVGAGFKHPPVNVVGNRQECELEKALKDPFEH